MGNNYIMFLTDFSLLKESFPSYPQTGVYLDSATQGLQPQISINSQIAYLKDCGYTVRKALHKRARISSEYYYNSKDIYSEFFNSDSDNFAFIPNADFGWNLIINSFINKFRYSIFKRNYISSLCKSF